MKLAWLLHYACVCCMTVHTLYDTWPVPWNIGSMELQRIRELFNWWNFVLKTKIYVGDADVLESANFMDPWQMQEPLPCKEPSTANGNCQLAAHLHTADIPNVRVQQLQKTIYREYKPCTSPVKALRTSGIAIALVFSHVVSTRHRNKMATVVLRLCFVGKS